MPDRRWAALVLGAAVALGGAAPAGAETSAEVRDLARRARTDPAALERLRGIHDVDGVPVDHRQALDGARGGDLERRLESIASSSGTGAPPTAGGADPRRQAERILEGRRFRPADPPRPLRGAIRRVGEWLEPLVRPVLRRLEPVGRFLADAAGNRWALGAAGIAVVAVAAFVAARLVARRSRGAEDGGAVGAGTAPRLDARQLERQAEEAEAAGEYDRAFRLRFLAGVARLDRAGVVAYRPSLTTGELVRTVPSRSLPDLARAFDEIAYGGRPTAREDVDRARQVWPRVLEEARA